MADFINRQDALGVCDDDGDIIRIRWVRAADVRHVAEVDSLVDKATSIINNYYTAMPYEVYCKILRAVEDIYSMNQKTHADANVD